MRVNRPVTRLLALAVALGLGSAVSVEATDCGIPLGTSSAVLPQYSGTLPGSADMTTAGGSSYLYVLTQWGMLRASISDPANPGAFSQLVVGKEGGSNNGGVIQIYCDCHQGGNTMDVAQASDGTARVISDWQPFKQGGGEFRPRGPARAGHRVERDDVWKSTRHPE